MTAWADYVDARQQLVHQWRREGASVEDIVGWLEVDEARVQKWLATAPEPFPGSVRAQLGEWKLRAEKLEAALHAAHTEPPPPSSAGRAPIESEMRALRLDPHVELCGCQYWTDAIEGAHHARCIYAPKAAEP